jgi:hypothetical protein
MGQLNHDLSVSFSSPQPPRENGVGAPVAGLASSAPPYRTTELFGKKSLKLGQAIC